MAILTQNISTPTFYTGWYGLCDDCSAFDLISGTGNQSAYIYDSIQSVFCISDNAQGTIVFNGLHTLPSLISIQAIKKLECGKSYRIIMKPGSGSLEIPSFVFGNEDSSDTHRIKDNCV